MKANELRIGNWVKRNCEKTVVFIEVKSIDRYGIGLHRFSDIEPIQLTPALMEKCGFSFERSIMAYTMAGIGICLALDSRYEDMYYEQQRIGNIVLPRKERSRSEQLQIAMQRFIDGGALSIKEDEYMEPINHAVKVQYLHQLQNIYFALTGRELAIKL